MANETLIARLEQSLRQSRAARSRLAARLAELESESEIIRAELAEMDTLAGQTEAAIFRLLSNVLSGPSTQVGTTSVGELEAELQRRLAQGELTQQVTAQRLDFMVPSSGRIQLTVILRTQQVTSSLSARTAEWASARQRPRCNWRRAVN